MISVVLKGIMIVFSLEIGRFHSFSSDFDFSTVKGLKIANLNVNSLTKYIDDLSADNPFDTLSINESKNQLVSI